MKKPTPLKTLETTITIFLLATTAIQTANCNERLETLPPQSEQPFIINVNGEKQTLYKQSFALIITMSDYSKSKGVWKNLPDTEEEGDQLAEILQRNGFTVRRGHDLTSSHLSSEILNLFNREGKRDDGRLLFFYSGHGHRVKKFKTTYLIPVDGEDPESETFYLTAYSVNQFRNSIPEMSARQAVFIFDNCYAGGALKSADARPAPELKESSSRYKALRSLSSDKVRQFIAAGTEDQQLPSPSIFFKGLIAGLKGAASTEHDGYVTGKELSFYVESYVRDQGVGKNFQTPGSTLIEEVAGDMIFQYDATKAHAEPPKPVIIAPSEPKEQITPPKEQITSINFDPPSEISGEELKKKQDDYSMCKNYKNYLPKTVCDALKIELGQ